MELRAGYKQTEVGVIPEDWEVKPLRKVVGYTNGKAHEENICDTGNYIVVNSKFISTNGDVIKYSDQCFLPAQKGDVLMVMSDVPNGRAIARCYFVESSIKYTVNQRICRLRPTDICDKFLCYKLDRNPFYLTFDDGAKQTNLRKEDVLSCSLSLPPTKAEQEAIAGALSDADGLIESLEQLIAKKRAIKQGTMQELLTGKKRLPGFETKPGNKQTEVGVIPEDWEVEPLSKVCFMKSGENITNAKINDYSPYRCFGGNGLRGYTNSFTHNGIFSLIGRQGALCGNVLTVEGKFYASEHAIVVTPIKQGNIRWLSYVLGDMNLNQYSESSAQPGLSVSKLGYLIIPLPPTKAEQEAIAGVLEDMDTEITALVAKLAKARQIKQGMMQELLTGKIRLISHGGSNE